MNSIILAIQFTAAFIVCTLSTLVIIDSIINNFKTK
jgi:hypothetical protein